MDEQTLNNFLIGHNITQLSHGVLWAMAKFNNVMERKIYIIYNKDLFSSWSTFCILSGGISPWGVDSSYHV